MKRIVVEVVPEETRMALIEDDRLIAAHAERPAHQHLVGNIYKCRVQNVLKGIEAAFVDIGAKKNAFLYIGDGKDKVKGETIHIGQSFPVQVTKDAWGTKGPSVTRTFSLPGRNVVLMPNAERIAISHRIADRDERYRLLSLAKKLRPEGMGIIVRTAAEGESEKALKDDVAYLKHLWEMLMARSRLLAAPSLLYRDADLIIRTIRDYMTDDVDELIVDDRDAYHRMIDLISYLSPELKERVKLYDGAVPLFHAYGIDDEMKTLRNRKVMLPSGGFLVIDRTEALTVIDVNTGSFVGRDNLADTVYKANLEAADEVIRQIRLRDIGGIIIVDFIDMDTDEQKEGLLNALREKVKSDPTKTVIVDITPLGLVEITRKKSRHNVQSLFYSSCPCCDGRGYVASPETVGVLISRDIRHIESEHHSEGGYDVELNDKVRLALIERKTMEHLANELSVKIRLTPRSDFHPERYVILSDNE